MNVQSNLYTFIYSTILVVVVALGLACTSISLKDRQDANIELEKKQNILSSIGIECSRDEAVNLFEENVINIFVLDYEGNIIEGIDGFKLDLKKEYDKSVEDRKLPVYECEKDGQKLFVFPLRGQGLWGPIWGYIALEEDFNTIFGATFDHKGETPGLGAEINTTEFQARFKGKRIFNDMNELVSILIKKPGKRDLDSPHQVDGLSGSTLTCNGLEKMLEKSLNGYKNYFLSMNNKK